jgi:hypothetical protein
MHTIPKRFCTQQGEIMLVKCPCGIRLNVQDNLVGRKVRCPKCADIFIAGMDGDEKGSALPGPKSQSPRQGNGENDAIQDQLPRKKKADNPRRKRREDDVVNEDAKEAPNHLKRIGGLVCCALAVLLFFGALSSIMLRGPSLTDPSGLGVSQAVGAFLPSFLMLILSAALLSKKKTRD